MSPLPILLRSGDGLCMAGEGRRVYHGASPSAPLRRSSLPVLTLIPSCRSTARPRELAARLLARLARRLGVRGRRLAALRRVPRARRTHQRQRAQRLLSRLVSDAVHEVGVPLEAVAEVTARKLGVPVVRLSEDELGPSRTSPPSTSRSAAGRRGRCPGGSRRRLGSSRTSRRARPPRSSPSLLPWTCPR